MYKIIVDTETSGLPTAWDADENAINIWPRIVEIAWIVLDENDKEISSREFIVKPKDFQISADASSVHGITHRKAITEGIDIEKVLDAFEKDLRIVELIIAHNIDFDFPVINCEFRRLNKLSKLNTLERFCTMKSSRDFCNINGPYGRKWPRLEELYFKLFDRCPESAHRASNDAYACYECYLELKKRGIIPYEDFSKDHKWSVGDKLRHKSYGIGEVEKIIGEDKQVVLIVNFAKSGSKVVDPRFAPITKPVLNKGIKSLSNKYAQIRKWKEGDILFHEKFGDGQVLYVLGKDKQISLGVKFGGLVKEIDVKSPEIMFSQSNFQTVDKLSKGFKRVRNKFKKLFE